MHQIDWSTAEVDAALVAAAVLILIWAVSGLWQGLLRYEARQEGEWTRLQELATTINNAQGAQGAWSQILAVRELRSLKSRQKEVRWLAEAAHNHWSNQQNPNSELIRELADLKDAEIGMAWKRIAMWAATALALAAPILSSLQ